MPEETAYVVTDGETIVCVVRTEDANHACAIARGRTNTISGDLEAKEVPIFLARRDSDR